MRLSDPFTLLHLNTIWLFLIVPSEGSVVAYYLSEFRVPAGQEASVDYAMSSLDKLVDKERRTLNRPGSALVVEDVTSAGRDKVPTTVVCASVLMCPLCCFYLWFIVDTWSHSSAFSVLLSLSSSKLRLCSLFLCFVSQRLMTACFQRHSEVSAHLASIIHSTTVIFDESSIRRVNVWNSALGLQHVTTAETIIDYCLLALTNQQEWRIIICYFYSPENKTINM